MRSIGPDGGEQPLVRVEPALLEHRHLLVHLLEHVPGHLLHGDQPDVLGMAGIERAERGESLSSQGVN